MMSLLQKIKIKIILYSLKPIYLNKYYIYKYTIIHIMLKQKNYKEFNCNFRFNIYLKPFI